MRSPRFAVFLLLAPVCVAPPVNAQTTATAAPALRSYPSSTYWAALEPFRFGSADTSAPAPLPLPKYGGWVGVTKWVTLAAAIGLGAAGAVTHRNATDIYEQLDALCQSDPDTCRDRDPDGSYSDPMLEAMYQEVLKKDQRARTAFVGAQISFGVSVLLFIVDFQRDDGPGNIPYDPDSEKSALRLTARPGELAIRYYFN
jgi:hypothetical protein